MKWNLDTAHSHVEFSVRHLGISTVKGRFRTFDGSAATDDTGALQEFSARIDPASIDTGTEQRDAHLRSPDFFDVAAHPAMEFASTKVTPTSPGHFRADGNLTMRGTTKPVSLDVALEAPVRDPYGNTKLGATATGRIKRSDWGLTWNQALEAGGLLVSDDVKITLEVQGASTN